MNHRYEVSVISATFRPGVDVFLAGMRDQTFPRKDFEVILCDRRYERRHDRVMALAKKYDVPLIHVPEHRRNKDGYTSFCAGWNTAAALARGKHLLLCQDWAYCPPGWIEAHLQHHTVEGRYVVGPYSYMSMPSLALKAAFNFTGQNDRGDRCVEPDAMLRGEVLDEVLPFRDGPFDPGWLAFMSFSPMPHQDSRIRPNGPGVPETYVHVKNESLRRELYYNLNGLDERMERGKGPMDIEIGMRMSESGVVLWWEQDAVQMVPNPRPVCRTMPFGDMHERTNGRWSYDDGITYIERRRGEIIHHNRFRALNPYDLYHLAERLEPWRTAETIDVTPLEKTDAEYWGDKHPLWWDTP